jgi:hypothetical protein
LAVFLAVLVTASNLDDVALFSLAKLDDGVLDVKAALIVLLAAVLADVVPEVVVVKAKKVEVTTLIIQGVSKGK